MRKEELNIQKEHALPKESGPRKGISIGSTSPQAFLSKRTDHSHFHPYGQSSNSAQTL